MDFSDNEAEQLRLMPGDLLVCEGGEIGRTAMWDGALEFCCYQNHLHRLRSSRDDVSAPFFMYWMQAAFLLLSLYGGESIKTTIPNLSQGRLKAFTLPKPPLPEQRAIAHTLSTIQRAIEAQEKLITAARELKKSLMRHLFTYGPVPLSQANQVTLKETEIGLVPEHWEVVRLESIALDERGAVKMGPFGSQLKKSELSNEGIMVYGQENVIKQNFSLCNRFVHGVKFEALKAFEVKPMDVLVTMMGTIGHSAVFPKDASRGIIDSHLIRIRIKRELIEPVFLKTIFETHTVKQEIEAQGRGVIMKGLNTTIIKNLFITLPPLPAQQEIARILSTVDKKIEAEQKRKAALQVLFHTMLHLLMTGKVRVKDLEVPAS